LLIIDILVFSFDERLAAEKAVEADLMNKWQMYMCESVLRKQYKSQDGLLRDTIRYKELRKISPLQQLVAAAIEERIEICRWSPLKVRKVRKRLFLYIL
jgi:hypothetical protein